MNRLLVSAALVLLPLSAQALKSDREKDLLIDAGHSEAVLTDDGNAVLSQGVKIRQGTLQIAADTATINKRAGEISSAVLNGTPATVEQQLDSGGQMKARAAQIDYDLQANVLVLTGDVVITQPEGDMRGEKLRYEIDSGRIEGGAPGSRVQMTIKPKAKTPAAD